MYIDSHSHWSDPRWNLTENEIHTHLKNALAKNITFFLQGGVNPTEWQKQKDLKKKYSKNFGLSFGLHPYFVAENDDDACELALDQLAMELPLAMGLGETGLDFRPHIMKDSMVRQIDMFENQIELAKAFYKPLILHIVQAHDKALQVLDVWGVPPEKGLVHAFTGSFDTAKKYIDRGFLISVGGAVTFEKNRKLLDCVQKIPLESLLIESDCPDQAPEGWVGLNESTSIWIIAEKIAQLRNLSVLDVLAISTSNFKRLFKIS
ncbi:MAG: TatD family hydrolase [Bdellovibrio sp.]|nr:TatD family hydrolase [Bdellovibrio sp.]